MASIYRSTLVPCFFFFSLSLLRSSATLPALSRRVFLENSMPFSLSLSLSLSLSVFFFFSRRQQTDHRRLSRFLQNLPLLYFSKVTVDLRHSVCKLYFLIQIWTCRFTCFSPLNSSLDYFCLDYSTILIPAWIVIVNSNMQIYFSLIELTLQYRFLP